jgi:hypothetical protein
MRRFLIAIASVVAISAPAVAAPTAGLAQQATRQDGLVNVYLNDVLQVENVNIAAVVDVVANVCPGVTANVAALASQVDQSGNAQTINCAATGDTIRIAQNNPGGRGGQDRTPPGRVQQDGLVNVFAADLVDVRDINIAAAAQILANVCPGITANVTAIASRVDESGNEQTITCDATGAPIRITQNNPGRGR